jgi:hypothetical protein
MPRSLTFEAVTPVGGKNGGVRVTCEVIDQINAWYREFKVAAPSIDLFYKQACRR